MADGTECAVESVSREIVYVLTNPAMPGLTKIGKTTQLDLASRLSQLYTTGVPVPFECVYACEVEDCAKVERAFHTAFGDHRVNPKREFFSIEPERVIAILQLLAVADVTPQVEQQLSAELDSDDRESREVMKRSKRPRMNFAEMGIAPGSLIVFKDDGAIQARVLDDRQVEYNGDVSSLTKLTTGLMGTPYQVQPSPYWTFEGRSLKAIYEETYSSDSDT